MLHSFGWIFLVLVGLAVVGLAVHTEAGRRRRAAAARRAVWKAHQDWLRDSAARPATTADRGDQPAQ